MNTPANCSPALADPLASPNRWGVPGRLSTTRPRNRSTRLGPTGSALDNAAAESFNSTLEWELLRNNHFHTREEARHAVAAWIDDYNVERRHSTNGMLSPVDY
ncbi:integrase core domain-containing protein, partial [Mycobacterium canetti]|uniref:integrase core domain-containing protein n=1 Tax=Mycobacterium canetti TaxID=78331 RepID=UPI002E1A5ED1